MQYNKEEIKKASFSVLSVFAVILSGTYCQYTKLKPKLLTENSRQEIYSNNK